MGSFKKFLKEGHPLKVNWDPEKGIANTCNLSNINYMGFITKMTPEQFLFLAAKWDEKPETDFIINAIKNGEGIAPPFFLVGWDQRSKVWKVIGHEGRSRCKSLLKLNINEKIPVYIFPHGLRRRDLTPEMLGAGFIQEKGEGTITSS